MKPHGPGQIMVPEDNAAQAAGLAQVLVQHSGELLRFLAARCGDAAEAEDFLQELWIKASRQSAGPIGDGRAYLFRMANNIVLDALKMRRRAMVRDRRWIVEEAGAEGPPEDRPDPAPNAEEDASSRQEAELVRKAVAGLPPGAREALRLYRFEGKSQGEIAQILGISRSGVEKHLALAMKHLRNALADCGLYGAAASEQAGTPGGSVPPAGQLT
ncbi:sigma-70 family RNA polymerase sigma factor [Erythrobacter sp. SG61-1L]|uniref:RNA polymerase sigma factor n=1 Tax=Erythrobacter sp. SG61-1L TaxID=1603897 RepID=UPI0006C8E8DF|nr:sigma-70 family RNA polymerase sigma factor [Erythrobacter sp. SG61-1L]